MVFCDVVFNLDDPLESHGRVRFLIGGWQGYLGVFSIKKSGFLSIWCIVHDF